MDCGQERCCAFGVTGGDAAPFFEMANGILDQMPQFVEVFVIRALLFAMLAWRNLHLHVLQLGLGNDLVAVVPFVGDQMLGRKPFNQFASLRTIRHGTRCNKDSDRHTMRIHGQMQLGIEPPFVRPISWLPPTAPAACAWALMWLASIISHSKSGSSINCSNSFSHLPLSRQRQKRR